MNECKCFPSGIHPLRDVLEDGSVAMRPPGYSLLLSMGQKTTFVGVLYRTRNHLIVQGYPAGTIVHITTATPRLLDSDLPVRYGFRIMVLHSHKLG